MGNPACSAANSSVRSLLSGCLSAPKSHTKFPEEPQILTVSNIPPALTFATWSANYETQNSLAVGTISNPIEDFDHDGRSNLIEYAFGSSPVIANAPAPRMPAVQPDATHFVIRYQSNTAITDVTLTPQASTDFTIWNTPGESGAPAGFIDELIATDGTTETREAKVPTNTVEKLFLRVRVSQP